MRTLAGTSSPHGKVAAVILFVAAAGVVVAFAGCGSETDASIPPADGGVADGSADGSAASDGAPTLTQDGSINEASVCKPTGQGCGTSGECCTANCSATTKVCEGARDACKAPGLACGSPTECCTGSCVNGACSDKVCVPDRPTAGACGQNGDCCSGICTNSTCASVNPGQTCRTSGNPCGAGADCCSNLCNNGLCSDAVSFCTQKGDICANSIDCCGGNCTKQAGQATGTCGDPTSGGGVPSGCAPSGTVCGVGAAPVDGGLPPCDQGCCSRACGFYGAFDGFRVCQPPSGCRPTGEVCRAHSDCCGWSGSPDPVKGPVTCSKATPTSEFGRCDNGGSCREPGSICKPGDGDSCSAENNCCENSALPSNYCNANPEKCCNKDSLGIPRCLIKPVDCATPPAAGTVCATSADCCGNPCVDNKCGGAGSCVAKGGGCTNSADCCPGIACTIPTGSVKGTCGGTTAGGGGNLPDGGTCTLYGQTCSGSAECCNGVPCTASRCRYP